MDLIFTCNQSDLCKYKEERLIDIAFGTKILNRKTNEIGLLIKTWLNEFADENIWFATCVDQKGKRYNIELDEITPIED